MKLIFKNPGKFQNCDPETIEKEIRETKKLEITGSKNLYDDNGMHIATSLNLCDCLDKCCPGCHFDCPKCGSAMCGSVCRSSRRWIYKTVEVEGTNLVRHFEDT